jgi:hypothetical protein
MVAGNYGYFVMDKKVKTVSGSPYTWEKMDGNIGVASATRHGIIVHSRRNWWFLFATTGRGWSLEGGLIGLVSLNPGSLELQAKSFSYDGPEFVPLALLSPHGRARESLYNELFLLHRAETMGLAVIVKKWLLPVDWKPAFIAPEAKLKYDAPAMRAIVDVVAPSQAASVSERIDVSTLVRAGRRGK